jgi:hypothetical protein
MSLLTSVRRRFAAQSLALLFTLFEVGCRYHAVIPHCSVQCGDHGACPSGTTCNQQDGFCHASSDSASCEGGGGGDGSAGSDAGRDGSAAGGDGSRVDAGRADGGVCQLGERRCAGSMPQSCTASGQWQDQPACAPPTPICNEGTCGPFRLRGAVGTVGVRPPSSGIQLREEKLEHTARVCSGPICVSGGITP